MSDDQEKPDDGPIKVKLSRPIMAHGEEVTELTFREIGIGELEGIDFGNTQDIKTIVKLVSRLANIPPSSAKTISVRDMAAVSEGIASFFGESPETSTG